MHFDWWTLSLQTVNFLVLVWLLWRFLFRPVKDIIARREELADAASGKLEEARKSVEEEKRRYEEARRELDEEQRRASATAQQELELERERTLEQAREEAGRIVREAREQVAEERRTAVQSLRAEVAKTAAGMAGQLLHDVSPETYTGVLLARIVERLEHLSAAERRQLDADLKVKDAAVEVVTAVPLEDAGRREWTSRLRALLNTSAAIEFATDPELIAGAVLKLPHLVVEFNWADQLQAASSRIAAT